MNPIHLRNIPPPAETFNHIHFLTVIAHWLKPERYLELGCRWGTSLIPISSYCKEVLAVDMNPPSYNIPQNCKVSISSTDDFFRSLDPDIKFDMVFIDADHSYEQSLLDFKNVKDRVIENGFVFLHDTSPYNEEYTKPNLCNDAYKTAKWIKNNLNTEWECVTLPFNPGLTILKRMDLDKQLAWE